MRHKSGPRGAASEEFVKDIRRATRKHYSAEEKVRIEAALLFYPFDMTKENTPWEVGLCWSVSRKKDSYRGKDAVLALEGKEKIKFAGIVVDHDDALVGGETLLAGGKEVGVLNCPGWSHRMNTSLALVHLTPEAAVPGTKLEVSGDGVSYPATVAESPFYDPQKTRTHS